MTRHGLRAPVFDSGEFKSALNLRIFASFWRLPARTVAMVVVFLDHQGPDPSDRSATPDVPSAQASGLRWSVPALQLDHQGVVTPLLTSRAVLPTPAATPDSSLRLPVRCCFWRCHENTFAIAKLKKQHGHLFFLNMLM